MNEQVNLKDIPLSVAQIEAALAARGVGRMVPTLGHIVELVDLLGSPQLAYPAIHITGTNGKTTTSRMIDALLRAHGLRSGRYTSPHLESLTERICVEGQPLLPEKFSATYAEVAPLVAILDAKADATNSDRVSYFEFLTAMAFAAFADAPVDAAVVEVGLGGAWDATNVLSAAVAVLTPIGLDHQRLLGDSLGRIATEKAGIIHENATVISAVQHPEAAEPLIRRAADMHATIAREGTEFGVVGRELALGGQRLALQGLGGIYDEIFLPLYGAHQAQNAALALAAVEVFLGAGATGALNVETIREGFAEVTSPGRLERLRTSPAVLVDAAHNPAGLTATLAGFTEAFNPRRVVVVLAVLADKDVTAMLELLEPVADELVVTENSSSRRLSADDLAALAVPIFGADRVEVAPRMDDALETAVRLAEEDDSGSSIAGAGVLVTGSVVTAAEARKLLSR